MAPVPQEEWEFPNPGSDQPRNYRLFSFHAHPPTCSLDGPSQREELQHTLHDNLLTTVSGHFDQMLSGASEWPEDEIFDDCDVEDF